jgi:outer membrane receptor protein involved in Fe transport
VRRSALRHQCRPAQHLSCAGRSARHDRSDHQPDGGPGNILFGGNVNLEPEKANTWTLGVVFVPEFLPKFSMSIDYYNIRIKDVIGSALPATLINACFGIITRPARLGSGLHGHPS